MNIFKIKAPLGYSTGTPLYPLIEAMYNALPEIEKVPKVKMLLTLTYNGSGDPVVYPLRVLDINLVDLGIANTPGQYMNIWNARPVNLTKGYIFSADNLTFEFVPVAINTVISLKATTV